MAHDGEILTCGKCGYDRPSKGRCLICQDEAVKRYRQTEKGRAALKKAHAKYKKHGKARDYMRQWRARQRELH